MPIKTIRRAAGIALLLVSTMAVAADPPSAMEQGLDALAAVERDVPIEQDPAPRLARAFAEHFGSVSQGGLKQLSDRDVRFYLRAANTLAFYSFDSRYLRHVEGAFAVLEGRGRVSRQDFTAMFDAYIEFRDFARAKALAARFAGMDHAALPEFLDETNGGERGKTVLSLLADGRVSRSSAAFVEDGQQVVVTAHPSCHFSENAVRAIQADPQLGALFAGRTLWLMPQGRHLDLDVVRAWNNAYPDYEMRWAFQTSDWPMVKRWATPNFYFFRDGKLEATVIGWPKEGRRQELIDAFRAIGVVAEARQASR